MGMTHKPPLQLLRGWSKTPARIASMARTLGLSPVAGEPPRELAGRVRVALAELATPFDADVSRLLCRLPYWDRTEAETRKLGRALGMGAEIGESFTDYRGRLRIALAEQIGPHSTDPLVWLARLPKWPKSLPETERMARLLGVTPQLAESLPSWRHRIAHALHERLY